MRQFNGTAPHLQQDQEERWVRVTLWRTPPADLPGTLPAP
jgi:ATP-dependent DNA helicase RecG